MNTKKAILIIPVAAIMLTGCSSINKVTHDIGINFWSKTSKKAPCKVVNNLESEASELPCIGTILPKPTEEEALKLRGRYTI